MKSLQFFSLLFFLCATSLWAQSEEVPLDTDIMFAPMGQASGEQVHKFLFISADAEHGGKIIKGAPYSAEAVTERVQTLADGNRIIEKSTASVFRDREGRTRREMQLNAIGTWEAAEDAPRRIFIHDPVGKMHYVLEPENKIARAMKTESDGLRKKIGTGEKFEHKIIGEPGKVITARQVIRYKTNKEDAKTESLGKQMMEGILVEGTRETITIPAGEMGNELPIQIIFERWFSPELQINVMTKHSDPRMGETNYRLTNIRRGEQDPTLFQVPKGYKTK